MKFKINRVKMVKEIGQITIDMFLIELQNYCDKYLMTKSDVKFDLSLLRRLCNILENSFEQKHEVDNKLDKKQTVLNEYIRLKQYANVYYTDEDKIIINTLIEDLHNTGQIKKVSSIKLWSRRIKKLLIKSE